MRLLRITWRTVKTVRSAQLNLTIVRGTSCGDLLAFRHRVLGGWLAEADLVTHLGDSFARYAFASASGRTA